MIDSGINTTPKLIHLNKQNLKAYSLKESSAAYMAGLMDMEIL